jgi:hypothetical protein
MYHPPSKWADVGDTYQHQDWRRIIDHRLVVNRQLLLAEGDGAWIKPRTLPPATMTPFRSIMLIRAAHYSGG